MWKFLTEYRFSFVDVLVIMFIAHVLGRLSEVVF